MKIDNLLSTEQQGYFLMFICLFIVKANRINHAKRDMIRDDFCENVPAYVTLTLWNPFSI